MINFLPCHMLWSFEAATVNLNFLSVKMLCSTFARTNCQEKFLLENLEIKSCDSVAAVIGRLRLIDPQVWNRGTLCAQKLNQVFPSIRFKVRNLPLANCILVEHVQCQPITMLYTYTVHIRGMRHLAYSFCGAYPELEVYSAASSTEKNASR